MRKKKQVLALFMAVSMMVNMLICIPVGAAITDFVATETEADAKNIETEEYINDTGSIIEKYHVQSFLCDISNIVPAGEKPELNEVLEMLPKELEAICWEKEESIMMPVIWECAGDYEGTSYYYYQFQPIWDEEIYVVDEELQVPYFGLMLGEGAFQTLGVTTNSKETTIYNFLKNDLGCNTATAVGILANIFCESSFDPTAEVVDTNGLTSYGICQWNGSRFTALQNYCSQNGYSYSSITGQLNYLRYELSTSEKNAWNYMQGIENSANGAYTAGYRWAQYFERCSSENYNERGTLARDTYWPAYRDVPIDNSPFGYLDGVKADIGKITVHGWAADLDAPNQAISVHFYAVQNNERIWLGATTADNRRADICTSYPSINEYHGYEATFNTSLSGELQVEAYGINVGSSGHNVMLWDAPKTVTVPKDEEPPVISNVEISADSEGYTVTCDVTDNIKIDYVLFPTWTSKDGQDDLQQPWNTIDTYRGEVSNGKAIFRVNRSDHNNEKGLYITHIYAFDVCGNVSKDTGSALYVFEEEHTHNYTKSVTKKATCTEKGVLTYTCIDCGDNYTEEIQPTGHVGNKIVKNQKAATTKEEGYTGDVYCADCGNLLSTGKVIEKLSEGEKPPVTKVPESSEHHKSHVGQTFVVNGLKYKVTKDDTAGREVRVTSMVSDTDTLNIPATVTNAGWKESFKVTSIKAKAFKNKSFAKAVIGNNVTKIGPNAFYHCWYLQNVVIGKSVKSIGVRAFYKCDYLKKVNIKSNVMTTVKKNAFKRLYWKAVIKVPKGKKQEYKRLLKGKIDRDTKVK